MINPEVLARLGPTWSPPSSHGPPNYSGAIVLCRMTRHFEWFTAHVSITPARFGSLKAHLLRCTIEQCWPLFVGLCLGLCCLVNCGIHPSAKLGHKFLSFTNKLGKTLINGQHLFKYHVLKYLKAKNTKSKQRRSSFVARFL